MVEMRNIYKNLTEVIKRRDYLRELGVERRLILRCILSKCGMGFYTGFNWPRMGCVTGLV
jgi:hypothetical protein